MQGTWRISFFLEAAEMWTHMTAEHMSTCVAAHMTSSLNNTVSDYISGVVDCV